MIKADIVCDICGKKRGRPYDHTLCAIKRKAKHAAKKYRTESKEAQNKKIDRFVKTLD